MLFSNILDRKTNINSDYLEEEVVNLLDMSFLIPENYNYKIYQVSSEYICRPDLISYDMYGDEMYSDVICKLNGVNPFEINEGMILVLPSIDSISDFIIDPEPEKDEKSFTFKKSNKTKTEKRKANEAITNDSRYKIDKINGVIIY